MMGALHKEFVMYFQEKKWDNFLGGSRRFGYDIFGSDVDLFVLIEKEDERYSFMSELKDLKFTQTDKHGDYPESAWSDPSKLIHVVIFEDKVKFNSLHADHQNLDYFFNDNPICLKIAKRMKLIGIKGSLIYKAFT